MPPGREPSWCRYPVRVSDLARVERRLKPFAVPGLWFVSVLEESESPSFGGYVEGSCPNAEAMVGHVVNLPTHDGRPHWGKIHTLDSSRDEPRATASLPDLV